MSSPTLADGLRYIHDLRAAAAAADSLRVQLADAHKQLADAHGQLTEERNIRVMLEQVVHDERDNFKMLLVELAPPGADFRNGEVPPPPPTLADDEAPTLQASSEAYTGSVVEEDDEEDAKRPFRCPQCVRTFAKKAGLVRHTSTHQQEGALQHKCGLCSATFRYPSKLARHMDCHTKNGDGEFKCTECPATFQHESSKIRHEKKQHA